MAWLRAWVFNLTFYLGSLFWSIALLWILILPEEKVRKFVHLFYYRYIYFITKHIMGIKLEIKGMEHLPKDGAYILASKHQSAYETVVLPYLIPNIAIILKEELTKIPLWGLYPTKLGMIAIDRSSGTRAMRSIVKGALKVKEQGRPILIFPQGTRVPPGETESYKSGVAKVYKDTALPIIPMALNAAVCWPKNGFIKKSGTITFEFLPMIPAGKKPQEMLKELENVLETHSHALLPPALQKEISEKSAQDVVA